VTGAAQPGDDLTLAVGQLAGSLSSAHRAGASYESAAHGIAASFGRT
jgi:hypothetical protein